jgi:integration host factor subunit alpha
MIKKNFTRKDLSNSIYKRLGFSKNFSSTIVDDFFETLIQQLVKFGKIKISSFGTFEVINKKERIGRNPKTKEEAKITSRKVVKFRPSSIFKKKINDNEKNI